MKKKRIKREKNKRIKREKKRKGSKEKKKKGSKKRKKEGSKKRKKEGSKKKKKRRFKKKEKGRFKKKKKEGSKKRKRKVQKKEKRMLRVRFHVQVSGHVWDDQRLHSATRLFGRHPSRCSAPLVFALRVASVCACVLVRLSHPRPPDRNQHGCTVGVLPGPTRVLLMPRQYGIGRRAPTRAVLSCTASWCVVVRRIHGLWNMPSVRFVLCPLALLLDMVTAVALSDLERHFAPLVAHLIR